MKWLLPEKSIIFFYRWLKETSGYVNSKYCFMAIILLD